MNFLSGVVSQGEKVLGTDIRIAPPADLPSDIGTTVNAFVKIVYTIGFLIAFFFLVWGGIKWITSGGDKAGTEAARNMITAALVGLGIMALVFVLNTILKTFLGIDLLNLTIPSATGK